MDPVAPPAQAADAAMAPAPSSAIEMFLEGARCDELLHQLPSAYYEGTPVHKEHARVMDMLLPGYSKALQVVFDAQQMVSKMFVTRTLPAHLSSATDFFFDHPEPGYYYSGYAPSSPTVTYCATSPSYCPSLPTYDEEAPLPAASAEDPLPEPAAAAAADAAECEEPQIKGAEPPSAPYRNRLRSAAKPVSR